MRNYFCGWYFRCLSEQQSLAVIASVHKTRNGNFCTIQLLSDTQAFHVSLPISAFRKRHRTMWIGRNRFGKDGILLNMQTPAFHVNGQLSFTALTPMKYDIMGPFQYIPFLQCRHSVYSMHHQVNGSITVNGIPYVFDNGIGYIEGDRGSSFPRKYLWTQCSFSDGALMLSIAEIPMGIFHFTGIIGFVLLQGKEYRLATYLGAKAVKIQSDEIIIQQGEYVFTIHPGPLTGHPLLAPVRGNMHRTIREHPACWAYYHFACGGNTILELDAQNAAFEYEY